MRVISPRSSDLLLVDDIPLLKPGEPLTAVSPEDADYVERARRAATRLSVRSPSDPDVRLALVDVQDAAAVDVDVPTTSADPRAHMVKQATKRLVGWYFRYVGQQVTVLGNATARLGELLVERTEGLQTSLQRLEKDLSELAARVERLERDRP
jgi:hypothetical protein